MTIKEFLLTKNIDVEHVISRVAWIKHNGFNTEEWDKELEEGDLIEVNQFSPTPLGIDCFNSWEIK